MKQTIYSATEKVSAEIPRQNLMLQSIICRCEDITYEDIVSAIDNGYETLEEIKRYLRCGMGLCQGKTCMPLIAKILSKKTGKKIEELKLPNSRPLGKPVPFAVFTSESPSATPRILRTHVSRCEEFPIPKQLTRYYGMLRIPYVARKSRRLFRRIASDYVSDEK